VNANSFKPPPAYDIIADAKDFGAEDTGGRTERRRSHVDTCRGVGGMSKALVVIDVQKAMWENPDYPPFDDKGVLERIAMLIAKARAAGTPVMYVQHHDLDEPRHPLKPGLPGYPFHERIAPKPGDDVTVKHKSSAFHATDLDGNSRRAASITSSSPACNRILRELDDSRSLRTRLQDYACFRCALDGRYSCRKGQGYRGAAKSGQPRFRCSR